MRDPVQVSSVSDYAQRERFVSQNEFMAPASLLDQVSSLLSPLRMESRRATALRS
jgi:hypothetical protein